MKLDDDLATIAIFICIVGVITFLLSGCTVHVTEAEPDYDDYCFANYYCSYYDYYGYLTSGYFCYEEIKPNMTCK